MPNVRVLRGGRILELHVRAETSEQQYGSDDVVLYWLVEFISAAVLTIVTTLVFLRPSGAAWALYTFIVCGQLLVPIGGAIRASERFLTHAFIVEHGTSESG